MNRLHVHAKKGEFESKAAFYIVDGIISEIKIDLLIYDKNIKA